MSFVASRSIPLLDLRAQWKYLRTEVLAEITRVADSQRFILGDDVDRLENDLATYCRVSQAIGCASGSDALTLAMMALGIGPGDAVVTVPYTFFATAGSIHALGARPVFVDVEPDTFNMDPTRLEEVIRSNPDVRAIIPVHLFGACADMDAILTIAARTAVPVIEDAAQAIGAEYRGRRAGSMGAIGCFSFFPSKNLGGFGDGGFLTTQDASCARLLRSLRVHGSEEKYVHDRVGVNSRLDALQAAVLTVKLRYLDRWTARRQYNADYYRKLFKDAGLPLSVPREMEWQTRCIYNQFVILCPRRDELRAYLVQRGIGTEIYYPIPLHLQQCFTSLGYKPGDFPISERLARESLALPIHPELPETDIDYIVEAIGSFYEKRPSWSV